MYTEQLIAESIYGEAAIRELIDASVIECQEHVDAVAEQMVGIEGINPDTDSKVFIYALLKLCGRKCTIQSLLGMIASKSIESVVAWTDVIDKCQVTGLYVVTPYQYKLDTFIEPLLVLEEEEINHINDMEYLPPMLCVPDEWTNNSDGGWLSHKGSCILGGKLNHHNGKQALDVLNILQSIPWVLEREMTKEEETTDKVFETDQDAHQYELMVKSSRKIYNYLGSKQFYYPWKYDKRGRIYSQGYQLHLQASEYKKSILNFAHSEVCTGSL